MTFALYDFQENALEAEARHRLDHPDETRLAIVLPTGTGKGTILAERAARFCADIMSAGTRVLILVHTDELVNDLAARCRLAVKGHPIDGGICTVGIVKAGQDDVDADIVVASVQTLANPERRARIRDVGLVIVDECHHATADSYQAILRHFGCMPDYESAAAIAQIEPDQTYPLAQRERDVAEMLQAWVPALGFTATLERTDGAGLGQVWQNVVFTRDISWAVRKGFLVQPVGYRLEIDPGTPGAQYGCTGQHHGRGTPECPRELHHHHDEKCARPTFAASAVDLDAQIADSIAPERIVEKWQELAADRQTIVFAPLVRSARRILAEFDKTGVYADIVHGEQPDSVRRDIIARFKSGKIQALVNAMVLTEGFDHPGVSCVIVARPTKSRPLFIQMAGRGLRRMPGVPVEDQNCILITLADTTSDICSVADLSDRPLDRKADGPLTVMEDEWDIGRHLEEESRHWTGKIDITQFDPIVSRSSKVWAKTKGGAWFLPISKDREYVYLLDESDGTAVYVLTRPDTVRGRAIRVERVATAPDVEMAMALAEDEATERGGDLGALLADRTRPWRKEKPKPDSPMVQYAHRLGLAGEVDRIMSASAGGKAGKISDLIRRVEASRSIDRAVERINDRKATA